MPVHIEQIRWGSTICSDLRPPREPKLAIRRVLSLPNSATLSSLPSDTQSSDASPVSPPLHSRYGHDAGERAARSLESLLAIVILVRVGDAVHSRVHRAHAVRTAESPRHSAPFRGQAHPRYQSLVARIDPQEIQDRSNCLFCVTDSPWGCKITLTSRLHHGCRLYSTPVRLPRRAPRR